MTFEELENLSKSQAWPEASARLLYNWYYKKNKRRMCTLHGVSPRTQGYLSEFLNFSLPEIASVHESSDKTVKFLFRLCDQKNVETVLIPFQKKYTVCLSSQVGCAMNCAFCYTGRQGFTRHLKTDEIVGQFLQVQKWLTENRPEDDRILNIVFMGQGEPLHNFESVQKATQIFISQYGLSLADHKITISTAGYLPGLQRWAGQMPAVNIALSLHSPFTEKRNQLIPLNRRYPLEDVIEAVEKIPNGKKRFVTYEYLLLKGFNDSAEYAHATGRLLQGKKALLNLIPFNPFPGTDFKRPEPQDVESFKAILEGYALPTMVRKTKGDQILAACGQLNTAEINKL